jgi:hypothetical protein
MTRVLKVFATLHATNHRPNLTRSKDMKHTFAKQARPAGIALATAVAFAALGTGTALAAPPAATPTFASAKFSIEAGNGGAETAAAAGGLTCAFRETGLQPFQLITYLCDAAVVGAVEGCVYKNKLVGNSATQLSVFNNPAVSLEGGAVGFVSNNSGRINGTITTAVPVSGGGHQGELCTEPAQAQVIAVRWCDASLTDTVNGLVGATAGELFQEFYSGAGTSVPSCGDLALMSPTGGGE